MQEVAFRFDEGQMVVSRRGGQSMSKAAALMENTEPQPLWSLFRSVSIKSGPSKEQS